MYKLIVAGRVVKRLKRLPPKHKRQVWERVKSLEDNPRPQDCKKLKGSLEGYRITVGEYRLLYRRRDAGGQGLSLVPPGRGLSSLIVS